MGQRKLGTEIPLVEVKGMDKNEKSEVWEDYGKTGPSG